MPDERKPKSHPDPVHLAPSLLDALRRALAGYTGSRADDGDLRRALRAIADDARHRGVRAEQLVVSLKRVFETLTPPPTLATADERAHRLSYLVTLCVQEYYATADDAAADDVAADDTGPPGPAGSH
jgi:hypothetical protein